MAAIAKEVKTKSITIPLFVALAALIASAIAISLYWPTAYDWRSFFRPAALALLSGHSPYTVPGYFGPPWALIPVIPFAVLPPALGGACVFVLTLLSWCLVARRLGASWLVVAVLALSPHVITGAIFGNLDWLAIIGFILPPQIGLFFILIKPQVGIGLALFWLWQAWRTGGAREAVRVFAPVTIALLLSFLLFGFWPTRVGSLSAAAWNVSLWPYSIPIAFVLLVAAIQNKKAGLSISASPFFSPYLASITWPVAILGLLPNQVLVIAATAGMWVIQLLTGLPLAEMFLP
jgi:hypothetical protein